MSETSTIEVVEIVEFGPYRAIGMSCVAKNENGEFHDLWMGENGFHHRMQEIEAVQGVGAFGICRCAPGVTDGSFEYMAALPATAEASVPEGMVEAPIAGGTYARFTVPNLAGIGQAWSAAQGWMAAHPEWKGFCGPTDTGCDCVDRPSFELYPPDFNGENELFIYMPVQKG